MYLKSFSTVSFYQKNIIFSVEKRKKKTGEKGEYVGHFDPTVPNVNTNAFFVIRYCWVEMTHVPPIASS